MTTLSFQSLPSSLSLYPKALINSYKAKKSADLPDLKANLSAVSIDRKHLAAYNATYDVAPPFGSPLDIFDLVAVAEQWNTPCPSLER